MTKPAKATAVLLIYFGYCAAAMGTGLVVVLDARSNTDPWQATPPLQNYVMGIWLQLFFVHLYGLFAPLMLARRMRRRAYGYFLGAATVGLFTTVLLLWLWVSFASSFGGGDCGLCLPDGLGWVFAISLGIGFVLPLAIAWWWRARAWTALALAGE